MSFIIISWYHLVSSGILKFFIEEDLPLGVVEDPIPTLVVSSLGVPFRFDEIGDCTIGIAVGVSSNNWDHCSKVSFWNVLYSFNSLKLASSSSKLELSSLSSSSLYCFWRKVSTIPTISLSYHTSVSIKLGSISKSLQGGTPHKQWAKRINKTKLESNKHNWQSLRCFQNLSLFSSQWKVKSTN